jgi:hypothetical protein
MDQFTETFLIAEVAVEIGKQFGNYKFSIADERHEIVKAAIKIVKDGLITIETEDIDEVIVGLMIKQSNEFNLFKKDLR